MSIKSKIKTLGIGLVRQLRTFGSSWLSNKSCGFYEVVQKLKFPNNSIIVLTAVIVFLMIACNQVDTKEVDTSQYYVDPPTGIVVTKNDNKTVFLTWNAVERAGSYEIAVRKDTENEDVRHTVAWSITVPSYTHNYNSYASETSILYYYIKSNPKESGYKSKGWSAPVTVNLN
ncbi:MAG: hypothetical protein LBV17_02425 [Treponema sp.]|jgi:hypothetical protein|nr:hypothetical protein [Treponema sp.]